MTAHVYAICQGYFIVTSEGLLTPRHESEKTVHYLRLSTWHSWLICVSRTTRYPTVIPIRAYKLHKLSSRNGTMSQTGILKWKLVPAARTHSLRSKLTGRERPCSIQSTFQLGVDSTQASQSQQSGNHKQEGWNSPRDLQQLRPGRQSLQTKWFPKHICTSEKAWPEAVRTNWRMSMGNTGNGPSWHPLHDSMWSTPVIGQDLGCIRRWPRLLPRKRGTQCLTGEDTLCLSSMLRILQDSFSFRTYQRIIRQPQPFSAFHSC